MNLRLTSAKVGDFPVGKPDKMVVGGGDRREQCINEKTEVGEQYQAEGGLRFPSLNLNSKAYKNRKKSVVGRPRWTESGLIVEVDVIGRRQVSRERKKGRAQKCKWVPQADEDLCMGKLGLGPNKLAAQIPVNVSCLGSNVISPITIESGKVPLFMLSPYS